ncbi:MAG: choice-of-anchor D domain-containing protein [Myxococcales bacterium]|nr:choice-of-anchor D domain-containing protein [Myxococcales bacterium]
MSRIMRASFALAAFSLFGCECGRKSGLSSSYAEIGVVWTDENGAEWADRDATYDFGAALMGDKVVRKLVIRNLGSGPLTLESLERTEGSPVTIGLEVQPNAAFDVRFVPGQTIPALTEASLDMYFTPPQAKDATVEREAHFARLLLRGSGTRPEEDTARILLKGNAEAGSCLLPKALDFGKVPVGERFQLQFDLRNTTSAPSQGYVGDPYSQNGDHTAFGVAPSSPKGDVQVPAQGSLRITFEFGPTELRPYAAKVKLRAGGNCPEGEISLTGEGVDEVLSWTPTQLDFGYVSPTTAAPKAVVFTNFGKLPVKIRNIATSLPADFGIQAAPGQDPTQLEIPGGAVPTELTVLCRPSGLGPRQADLTFDTGLTKQPKGTVALKCFGGGPNIQVIPRPTLAFGKVGFFAGVSPAPSVVRKVTVMNTGTKPPVSDPNANLKLGSVGPNGPGQLPLVSLQPLNATTAQGEFSIGLPSSYDPAVGLEATVGKNILDLVVTLTPQSVGTKEANLVIYSNDPDEPAVTVKLTADAQVVPPCNYSVTPAQLNFGLVTPPTYKDLPVTITNLGASPGDLCYLSGIEVAAGSDPAYSIVGGPIASKELQPKESFQILVRSWPQGQVPTGVVTLSGVLQFNASSPTKPQGTVPLTTSMGPACLTIAPDNLDFGTVKKGCNSAARTFTLYNICSQNVTLKSFAMQAAAGQPAGGPDCPGTQPCPEFFLVSTPTIPSQGLTLSPGAAPVTFQAKYKPIDFGTDSGAIAISAIQAGQNVTYLVSLQGTGDASGLQTDVFVQDAKPKADILLTVDSSCSMQDKQTSLGNNFASFLQYANSANVDYHIGVTTTDDDPPIVFNGMVVKGDGEHGRLLGDSNNPKVLTPATPDLSNKFRAKVNVGTNGSGAEKGLDCSLKAVTPPLVTSDNAGFLRFDANLAIVVVTDALDQSVSPVSYYFNRFMNIKGFNKANMFTFNVIAPFASAAPGGCTYDDSAPDDGRYLQMVTQTNGVKAEICDSNWSQKLQDLGKIAFGFRTVFFLNSTPDLSGGKTIEVKVDGQVVPPTQSGSTVWSYDPVTNAVKFEPTKTPGPGQTLSVTYYVACL